MHSLLRARPSGMMNNRPRVPSRQASSLPQSFPALLPLELFSHSSIVEQIQVLKHSGSRGPRPHRPRHVLMGATYITKSLRDRRNGSLRSLAAAAHLSNHNLGILRGTHGEFVILYGGVWLFSFPVFVVKADTAL
jgi:hypothetical protein